MSGSITIDTKGVYGIKGIPDINNIPGNRIRHSTAFTSDGNLVVFGGWYYSGVESNRKYITFN